MQQTLALPEASPMKVSVQIQKGVLERGFRYRKMGTMWRQDEPSEPVRERTLNVYCSYFFHRSVPTNFFVADIAV